MAEPSRPRFVPVPRTTLATAVVSTFVILLAIIIAILQINSRTTGIERDGREAAICSAREAALNRIANRLSHEQLARKAGLDLMIPDDLEPRLPLDDGARDPCRDVLAKSRVDVDALVRDIAPSMPLPSSTTTTVHKAAGAKTTRRSYTTLASRPGSTSTTRPSPPPTTPPTPCTLPVQQLCSVPTP